MSNNNLTSLTSETQNVLQSDQSLWKKRKKYILFTEP